MFRLLQTYEPGRGLDDGQPVLLFFKNGKHEDLAKIVAKKFPKLSYTFDGTKPALKFNLENHRVLFEVEPK